MTDRPQRTTASPTVLEALGIVLIVLGGLYLLAGENLVTIGWDLIWPTIVIAIGAVIVWAALAPGRSEATAIDVPRDGAQRLELDLGAGGGDVRLAGGGADLVAIRSNHDDIRPRIDRDSAGARVKVRQDLPWFVSLGRSYADWEVRVADGVPTALSLNAGAGRFDVDLSAIRLIAARCSFGAAQGRVTLPHPNGDVPVSIQAGAASLVIAVPAAVEARVLASGGLLRMEGRTETPGYATARDRVTVTVGGGAASVQVV
jgi:hypothetical protein